VVKKNRGGRTKKCEKVTRNSFNRGSQIIGTNSSYFPFDEKGGNERGRKGRMGHKRMRLENQELTDLEPTGIKSEATEDGNGVSAS